MYLLVDAYHQIALEFKRIVYETGKKPSEIHEVSNTTKVEQIT